METDDVKGHEAADERSHHHQDAERNEPVPKNSNSGSDPAWSSSFFTSTDIQEEAMPFQTDGEASVADNSADNVLDDGGKMRRVSSFGTTFRCGSDAGLSSQTASPGKATTLHPTPEEEKNLTRHGTDNNLDILVHDENRIDSNNNDDDKNKSERNHDKSPSHNDCHNDHHLHPSRKRVAWQTDCELEVRAGSDSACSEHLSNGVYVESGDPQSPAASCSVTHGNKRPREVEHDPNAVKSRNILLAGEIKKNALCLTVQRNDESKDLTGAQSCLGDIPNTVWITNTEVRAGTQLYLPSNLLARRRPHSASGFTNRQGQSCGNKAFSGDSWRSFSAVTSRRRSLPQDHRHRVSNDNSQKSGCSEQVTRHNSSDLLNTFVHDVEKESKRTVLVTYSAQEQTKSPNIPSDSVSVTDKLSRPPSPRIPEKSGRCPQTARTRRALGTRTSRGRMIHSAPPRVTPLRPWEFKFTKEELQRALPRRNFFSCHSKALKDAGFEVEEESARPRRRRLLFFHHEDNPADTPQVAAPPTIHQPLTEDEKENGREDNVSSDNTLETAVQMLSLHERAKRPKSQVPQVGYKPLQLYLSYVAENPGEYRQMVAKSCTSGPAAALHPSSHPANNCHTARLVSMGRVFQERHGGKQRSDEVLRAAYSLNPRDADPIRFAKPARDKSPRVPSLMSRKPSSLPSFQKKESAVSSHSGVGEDGSKSGQRSKPGSEMAPKYEAERLTQMEHLMEVEKRRLKAEEWARTVTTEQLVRAKLQVLKELSQEEQELSQWWLAFRTCFYLRPRIRE